MMSRAKLQPGDLGYVEETRGSWDRRGIPEPVSLMVCEYHGDGDPAFGGQADDRMLGPDGVILSRDQRSRTQPLEFGTLEQAHAAAAAVRNRRPGSVLGIVPRWR